MWILFTSVGRMEWDWCDVLSDGDVGSALVCRDEEGAESKGEALN